MNAVPPDFAGAVVAWQKRHGRHDLPWQNTRDPYRVWLSEIMLQQTQVATVRGYFQRFVDRFPDVKSLASANVDDVMALWSGLGYYSRARNLHRCAKAIASEHHGIFPQQSAVLQTLPGIGKSTAAAIASLCFAERVAILDANVRRVVSRVTGFDADLSVAAHERALWLAATDLLPSALTAGKDMPRYTQGMMDLGATVCVPREPRCTVCPVRPQCVAAQKGDPQRYPVRSRKVKRSSEPLWLLWLRSSTGLVWLHRRPAPGIWAGLYCLPVFGSEEALQGAVPANHRRDLRPLQVVKHVLTHKDLYLHPLVLTAAEEDLVMCEGRWFSAQEWPTLGLPAPIRMLLATPDGGAT